MQYVTNLLPSVTAYLNVTCSQRSFDLILRGNLSPLIRTEGDKIGGIIFFFLFFPPLTYANYSSITFEHQEASNICNAQGDPSKV